MTNLDRNANHMFAGVRPLTSAGCDLRPCLYRIVKHESKQNPLTFHVVGCSESKSPTDHIDACTSSTLHQQLIITKSIANAGWLGS